MSGQGYIVSSQRSTGGAGVGQQFPPIIHRCFFELGVLVAITSVSFLASEPLWIPSALQLQASIMSSCRGPCEQRQPSPAAQQSDVDIDLLGDLFTSVIAATNAPGRAHLADVVEYCHARRALGLDTRAMPVVFYTQTDTALQARAAPYIPALEAVFAFEYSGTALADRKVPSRSSGVDTAGTSESIFASDPRFSERALIDAMNIEVRTAYTRARYHCDRADLADFGAPYITHLENPDQVPEPTPQIPRPSPQAGSTVFARSIDAVPDPNSEHNQNQNHVHLCYHRFSHGNMSGGENTHANGGELHAHTDILHRLGEFDYQSEFDYYGDDASYYSGDEDDEDDDESAYTEMSLITQESDTCLADCNGHRVPSLRCQHTSPGVETFPLDSSSRWPQEETSRATDAPSTEFSLSQSKHEYGNTGNGTTSLPGSGCFTELGARSGIFVSPIPPTLDPPCREHDRNL